MRIVKEYPYDFVSFAKKRWIGKSLIDIYLKEFKAFSRVYYEEAIIEGRITVNGKKVPLDFIIENGDKIVHTVTRRESPVLD